MSIAVKLRLLAVEDAAVMAEVLADPSLYAFTGGEPPTTDELSRRYGVLVAVARPTGVSNGSTSW